MQLIKNKDNALSPRLPEISKNLALIPDLEVIYYCIFGVLFCLIGIDFKIIFAVVSEFFCVLWIFNLGGSVHYPLEYGSYNKSNKQINNKLNLINM